MNERNALYMIAAYLFWRAGIHMEKSIFYITRFFWNRKHPNQKLGSFDQYKKDLLNNRKDLKPSPEIEKEPARQPRYKTSYKSTIKEAVTIEPEMKDTADEIKSAIHLFFKTVSNRPILPVDIDQEFCDFMNFNELSYKDKETGQEIPIYFEPGEEFEPANKLLASSAQHTVIIGHEDDYDTYEAYIKIFTLIGMVLKQRKVKSLEQFLKLKDDISKDIVSSFIHEVIHHEQFKRSKIYGMKSKIHKPKQKLSKTQEEFRSYLSNKNEIQSIAFNAAHQILNAKSPRQSIQDFFKQGDFHDVPAYQQYEGWFKKSSDPRDQKIWNRFLKYLNYYLEHQETSRL